MNKRFMVKVFVVWIDIIIKTKFTVNYYSTVGLLLLTKPLVGVSDTKYLLHCI